MSMADNILRRLDTLESALTLKKNGVPDQLIALCYSDKPQDIEEAKAQMLNRYDVKSEEVLEAAGSSIEVAAFSWAAGRGVGITSNVDPRIPEPIRDQTMAHHRGKEIAPVIGTQQSDELVENPAVES